MFLLFCYLVLVGTATRDLVMKKQNKKQDLLSLSARLQTNGGEVDCWGSMWELRSCSNEIVAFFINGEADIGPDCCDAISVITRNCWPAMLTSLGFSAEEGYVLQGYCDAAASNPALAPHGASSSIIITT